MNSAPSKGFLSDAQRNALNSFPETLEPDTLIQYFLLSNSDLEIIPTRSPSYSRVGFALSLCALRFLGFIPESLASAPKQVCTSLVAQLNLGNVPDDLAAYGERAQTRSNHASIIEQHLGFRSFTKDDQKRLNAWLLAHAMEHERPSFLLKLLLERLKKDNIVRPALNTLERWVITVRVEANHQTYAQLKPVLTESQKNALDALLINDPTRSKTRLTWLRNRAVSHAPSAICETLEKIEFLEQAGVARWDLSGINVNRLKFLNRLGKHSTNQSLQRSAPEKRYPILVALMHQALEELIDEAVDLFDRALSHAYSRSKTGLKNHQEQMREQTNKQLILFKMIGSLILDEGITDTQLRPTLYQHLPTEQLCYALEVCDRLIRPPHDKCLDYFVKRMDYLRRFSRTFLSLLTFQSLDAQHPVLQAVGFLKTLYQTGARKVLPDAPTDFINAAWRRYVFQGGGIDRKYYELCTLWALRNTLRSGDIWVEGGRRYTNPEYYLIPRAPWQDMKVSVCAQLNLPECADDQLTQRQTQMHRLFNQFNTHVKTDPEIRIESDRLLITPLDAEPVPPSLKQLRRLISARLPKVDLPDLLVEVDQWTGFSEQFHHAGQQEANAGEYPIYLYAALLSEATNLGPAAMADVTDLDYERIIWYKNWYLRPETLEQTKNVLVNFQHGHAFSKHFGSGTFSSSDGRRIPVSVKTKTARALVKYFGYGTGLNLYSWTSDQFSQYGYRVTAPTLREATFVLDAILDNETELNIERHTTDTAGYTEIIFALFDLLGIDFEPRIRSIGDQNLYYLGERPSGRRIASLLKGPINTPTIIPHWDEVLRLVASLKKGWVSASLFVSKLQALPRKSDLAKALQEYGKIPKTISILRYALSKERRHQITAQLNKGEALHDLQQFLHLGREGRVYTRQEADQDVHFGCLNLLINMVIVWNTVYMAEVIEQLTREGVAVKESDLKRLSPARRGHINPYGKYRFSDRTVLNGRLRPLRSGG